MKINRDNLNMVPTTFEKLNIGDVFVEFTGPNHDNVFMKCYDAKGYFKGVSLTTGVIHVFPIDTCVIVLDAELQINGIISTPREE